MKRKLAIEIVEASPIEWGLFINGNAVRTWWKSQFPDGKPNKDHPAIKHAIGIYIEMDSERLGSGTYLPGVWGYTDYEITEVHRNTT